MESDKRDAMAQEEETQTERELERAKRLPDDPNAPGYAAEMAGAEPEEDDDSPPAT